MQVIDAVWEKRNMGIEAVEIVVGEDDSALQIRAALRGIPESVDYAVVKVPVARIDVNTLLSDEGFVFAEALLRVSRETGSVQYASPMLRRLANAIRYAPADDLSRIQSNIRRGMFTTDRVALDPLFSPRQAAERYCGWMQDEMNRGAHFFEYLYRDDPVGFVCLRKGEGQKVNAVLGGLYPADKPLPLGGALICRQLDIGHALGGKLLETYISTNNRPVVKGYSQCGYQFIDMQYVFVRHPGK